MPKASVTASQAFFAEKTVVEYMRRLWSIHGNVPTELRSALVSPPSVPDRVLSSDLRSHWRLGSDVASASVLQSHLLYRLDYDLRSHGLAESADAPRLSLEMLKPQPKGEDKSRDNVLKRESLGLSTGHVCRRKR